MSKASARIRGKRAIHRVKFPTANAGHLLGDQAPALVDAQGEAGVSPSEEPNIGIRGLTGWEWAEVLRQAAEFAVSRGGKAEDADEQYQLGKMAYTLLIGCVDPDDAEHGPFFDGGLEQILRSTDLGRDGIAYLYEQIELWQDVVNPQVLRMDAAELDGTVEKLAGPEDSALRFFGGLRRGMQYQLARSLAALLATALTSSSSIGGESAGTSAKQSKPPSNPTEPDGGQ